MGNNKNELDAIKSRIIDFYNDPLYQELNAYYSKKTIFNILKIERNENRHSAFLAWLLDENGSHGLGEEPLKRFMRLLAKMDDRYNEPFLVGNYQIEDVEVVTEKPAKVEGQKKTGRVDIFISFDYKLLNGKKVEEKEALHHVRVIVENKVYTDEHDDQTKLYLDWARQEYKKIHNQTIIGVFLAPEKPDKCSGDVGDFKYVKITYQDILQDLVEPLLKMEMSQESRIFITDYVINLGQPVQDKGEGEKSNNQDTILAISVENEQKFCKLYEENNILLDAALYAKCYERNSKQLQTVFHDLERFNEYSKETLLMLETFWDANSDLLRMTLNTALKDGVEDDVKGAVNVLLRLNDSNRDNTKYLVYAADGTLMNEKDKPSPKSLSSYYIFKAWMHDHPNADLREIREAFSVKECAGNYLTTYQFLFYRKADILDALKTNKAEGRTYYNAPLDENNGETIKANKYLTWDFFIDDDKRCLEIQGEKVLSVKMWLKNEFDHLIDYAKERFGILVKEQ